MTATCVGTSPTPPAHRALESVPAAPHLPIRLHGGVQVPAAGVWPLLTSSYVARTNKRGEREQLHIRAGWLDVSTDPTQCWMHVQFDGRVFDLTATDIVEDSRGLSAWRLTGVADTGDHVSSMSMSLRYHGVFRRGDQMWAWYSGTAVIDGACRRREERLHLDLSFQSL